MVYFIQALDNISEPPLSQHFTSSRRLKTSGPYPRQASVPAPCLCVLTAKASQPKMFTTCSITLNTNLMSRSLRIALPPQESQQTCLSMQLLKYEICSRNHRRIQDFLKVTCLWARYPGNRTCSAFNSVCMWLWKTGWLSGCVTHLIMHKLARAQIGFMEHPPPMFCVSVKLPIS